ncbi:MAG: hypothetical protein U9Q27_00760 [Patescibacteria group bacterium]|nr:hypothetical protein [Patescibacteria group bacterium]
MDLSNFTISQIHNGLKNKDFFNITRFNIIREDKAEAQSDEVVENLVQAIPNKEKRNAKVKAIL